MLDNDPNSLDMPFQDGQAGQTQPIGRDTLVSGGAIVAAVTVPTPDGVMPALLYRFAKPDGTGFHPPVLLVADEQHMRKMVVLTSDAVSAANRAARKAKS